MSRISLLKISNLLGFVVMLTVNSLSNSLPINGKTPGQLSDQYQNFFVPAGGTFSIWGIIYSWLLVFMGTILVSFFNKSLARKIDPLIEKTGWFFIGTCILNISWLFAWHYEFVGLSVLVMLAFLATLILTNLTIGSGLQKANATEKWLFHAPMGIYQGWISIATIANVTALLIKTNWQGWGIAPENWAIIMILIGSAVAVAVIFKTNNIFHGFAVLWALVGIYSKRNAIADAPSLSMIVFIWIGFGLVAAMVLYKIKPSPLTPRGGI
jgi:hypothetical protein